MAKESKKTLTFAFKTTEEIGKHIEDFLVEKSKSLGVNITKNQAIELLIVDGLQVNGKKIKTL